VSDAFIAKIATVSLLQKGHCTAKHAKAAKKKQNHESFFKAVRVKV